MWLRIVLLLSALLCGGCIVSLSWAQKADVSRAECETRGGFWEVQYDKQVRVDAYRCVAKPPTPETPR